MKNYVRKMRLQTIPTKTFCRIYHTLNGGLEFAALALRVRVRVRVRVQLVKEQQQLLALLDKHGLDLSMGKV